MQSNLSETLERYENAVLSDVESAKERATMLKHASAAIAEGSLYGPFTDREGNENPGIAAVYLNNAASAYENGDNPSALAELRAHGAAKAINVVMSNMDRTSTVYKNNRPNLDLTGLNTTRSDIVDGVIRAGGKSFLPEELAMTREEGERQVRYADEKFGELSADQATRFAQLFIADANYRDWDSGMMSTGNDMLKSSMSLSDRLNQNARSGMSHLEASNMMIGSLLSKAAEMAPNTPITVINLGAGSGATTVMNAMGLASADHSASMRMVDIEGTHAFYRGISEGQLSQDVLNKLRSGGYSVGDSLVENPLAAASAGNESSYGVAYGDMLDCVERLSLTPDQKEGLVVVTANYSLHRLPLVVKEMIFEKLNALADNVLVLMGDLNGNWSFINTRYFNLGLNGPANCGNEGTANMLIQKAYGVEQISRTNAPDSINPVLLENIISGPSNDAHFLVGSRGPIAEAVHSGWATR